jgi:hypothetical protein
MKFKPIHHLEIEKETQRASQRMPKRILGPKLDDEENYKMRSFEVCTCMFH